MLQNIILLICRGPELQAKLANTQNYDKPFQKDRFSNTDEMGNQLEFQKSGTFNTLDAEFFQSLNDFKSDFLFNKTELILSKPPHIYRQVSRVKFDNLNE